MDKIGIANLALGELGSGRLTDVDNDPSKRAQLVRDNFDPVRDATFEDRDWTFAQDRRVIQRDAVAPAFGYASRYGLPGDIVRVVKAEASGPGAVMDAFAYMVGNASAADKLDWIKEGRFVLADTSAASLNIVGIQVVEDPTVWSPTFCIALAARLAWHLCIPLTENRNRKQELWVEYQKLIHDGAANDGRQGRSQRWRSDSIASRRR